MQLPLAGYAHSFCKAVEIIEGNIIGQFDDVAGAKTEDRGLLRRPTSFHAGSLAPQTALRPVLLFLQSAQQNNFEPKEYIGCLQEFGPPHHGIHNEVSG